MNRPVVLVAAFLAGASTAVAQQSTSFKLEEHTFNNGGDPNQGQSPGSAGYLLTLDALGDAVARVGMASASYQMDGGFLTAYPPPREVLDLRFTSQTAMAWDAEPAVGTYSVYRGLVSSLPGGYGGCQQSGLTTPDANDAALPPAGEVFFYLITAENRLGEEGTKGSDSSGTPRPNPAPCP